MKQKNTQTTCKVSTSYFTFVKKLPYGKLVMLQTRLWQKCCGKDGMAKILDMVLGRWDRCTFSYFFL